MFEWKEKASNAILLDDNVGGKGKTFRTRFLQAGLVKYSFGVCLLEKETIDRFVYQFEGCPVIINHKDVTSESAKDDRVGVISKVEYNQYDGWYWAEGVIFEQEALNLIDKGYNVSCQYEITEYSVNKEGKLHNGNEYDKVILNGRPEHLAIVENPRYENAMIAVNALELGEDMQAVNDKKEFVTVGEDQAGSDTLVVVKKAAATDLPLGVVVYNPIKTGFAAGEMVSVFPDDSYVYLPANAATIKRGNKLQFTADGKVAATTTASNGYIGIAITQPSAVDDLIVVQIKASK
ncbi:unnamed protein product [Cylicocyclus nassatus]|uniref:Uncharacterized protein n=1 Tax=Cylicocyclus nassatus TaxID=53992 RepID=A0AA36HH98_CYLNA|nr:unnamed protein product [Cylicocyclus nassatus]